MPRTDYRWGAQPALFVRLSGPTTVDELREWCAVRLDIVHRPVLIQVVEAMPVTHRGKIDYRRLEGRAEGGGSH